MSVLIKGMDMPKNCKDCFFLTGIATHGGIFCDCGSYVSYGRNILDVESKPDWCPLVEVPQQEDQKHEV